MFIHSLNRISLQESDTASSTQDAGIHSLPVCIILLLTAFGFFAVMNYNVFELYFYESYGYIASVFLISCAVFIQLIGQKIVVTKEHFISLAFIFLSISYCIVSAQISDGGYRYVGAILNTMGVVTIMSRSRLDRTLLWIFFILLCVSGIYCIATIDGYYLYNQSLQTDSVNSNYLAFFGNIFMGYGNYLLTCIRRSETVFVRIFRLFLCVGSFYIIWECQSRGALFSWIFYILFVYVFPVNFLHGKTVIWTAGLIAAGGVMMTWLYVSRFHLITATFLGKSTATRYRLWSYFWAVIPTNLLRCLTGYGTRSDLRKIFGYGLHNIYIGIWYDIGFLGLLLFMGFILWSLYRLQKNGMDTMQTYALVGFLSFMINDYFAVTFTGPLVIWNYVMLGFAFCGKKKIRKGRVIIR